MNRAIGLLVAFTTASFASGCLDHIVHVDGRDPVVDPAVGTAVHATHTDRCSFAEPNNEREQSTSYALGDTVYGCITENDVDFFEFQAPGDVAGGYVKIDLSNVGITGAIEYEVYSVSDNGQIFGHYGSNNGQSIAGYFTAAAGVRYRVAIRTFSGYTSSYDYDLKMAYTPFVDVYEPNDRSEEAKPIPVGAPIEAMMSAGHEFADISSADFEDWYSVDLASGSVHVKLENVPSDVALAVSMVDSSGNEVGSGYSSSAGASAVINADGIAAGTYKVRVHLFSGDPKVVGRSSQFADTITKPYKLTVGQ